MEEWWTRHSRSKMKKKGDVGVENEKEKDEGEKVGSFFCTRIFDRHLRISLVITCRRLHLYRYLCLPLSVPLLSLPYPLVFAHVCLLELRPMTSIGRSEASNTRAPS